jgi:hypothetical protein
VLNRPQPLALPSAPTTLLGRVGRLFLGLLKTQATGAATSAGRDGEATGPGAGAGNASSGLDPVAVLLLVDLAPGAQAWAWGWSRIVWGSWLLRGVPGLCFAKALGSGHEGGFGLRPSNTRQGLFVVFGSERQADTFLAASPVLAAYRRHARELCVAKLRAVSCRGTWSGVGLQATAQPDPLARVAALTRASIRPSKAWAFWRYSPASEVSLAAAPGCELAAGLGEAPLLRQATFSVWRDQASMNAYARQGAHLQAIHAAQQGGYFSESMFVRFQVLQLQGSYKGQCYA